MTCLGFSAHDRAILLWTLAGCFMGPVAFAVIASAVGGLLTTIMGHATVDTPAEIIAGILFASFWGLAVALFASPVVAPVLVIWVAVAKRLPWIETRRGIMTASAAGAASAALVVALSYATMDRPFGAHGRDLAGTAVAFLIPVWLGLVLPRLIIPALRPGLFTRSATSAQSLAPTSER